jgi:hypothetical protein
MYGIRRPYTSGQITGTSNSNPEFVNPGTDFHLKSENSPANGAGTKASPVAPSDHDGFRRSSPPAIGAYEYVAGAAGKSASPPAKP